MSKDWIPFSPTYTYKRKWYERFMFWKSKIKYPAAVYKQVGKTIHIKITSTTKDVEHHA